MILIGLTGSIAMGKSTVASMFAELGAPVFDADRVVHAFYASPRASLVEAGFPGVLVEGAIDRRRLAERVLADAGAMRRLEAIVHPIVEAERQSFVRAAWSGRARQVVIDSPLLFETGAARGVDIIVVVSAAFAVQKARALARPGMTPERFESILARQTPDGEKRRQAHFVVQTNCALAGTKAQALDVLRATAGMSGRSY
jgi:dephospho-CoA kinase